MYPRDTQGRYNRLKRKTLAALRNGRAVSVPTLAARVGYYPIRGFYPDLARLRRWVLLESNRNWSGRLLFRISERGRASLRWLERNR
jgi:hypothetical protein